MQAESSNNHDIASMTLLASKDTATNDSAQNDGHQAPTQKRSHKKRKSGDARLRKLWRRATTTSQGITSRVEWEELTELHSEWVARNSSSTDSNEQGKDKYADKLPGPSVSIKGASYRDFRKIEEWQSTKVADHRDILANLLFGGDASSSDGNTPSKKKRKPNCVESSETNSIYHQKTNVPSLPSWANICNLASMGGAAVIEIDINDSSEDAQSKCSLMPSEFLQQPNSIWEEMFLPKSTESDGKDIKQKVKRIIGVACKVKMFQGDHPRCISDELMFLPPPSASKLNGSKSNKKDLLKVMLGLKLSRKQLNAEGFPTRTGEHVQIDENSELHSKITGAKESVGTRAKSYWDKFDAEGVLEATAVQNDSNALELVESLSVKETVCCGESEAAANDCEPSKSEFYVQTFLHDKHRNQKIFALDCEMVQTAAGPELARVSVVLLVPDSDGHYNTDEPEEKIVVVLDELVKPRRPILDYVTEYSGITPEMLQDVNTRIEDVQAHLLSLIQDIDVIVGHSLENDLKALRLIHTNVVDTSIIFSGGNGRKYGLRHLTNILLKRQIQSNNEGHCSTEDAEATLILAAKRAKLGQAFQLKENSKGKGIMRTFQSINRDTGEHMECFAERSEGSCVCIGSNAWISKYTNSNGSHHVLSCDSLTNPMSMSIPSWLSSSSKRSSLLWANLTCDGREKSNELKRLEEISRDLHRRVPLHTPIIMIFQRKFKQTLALTKERKMALKSKTWTHEQEQKWRSSMDLCMSGEAVWMFGVPIP